MASNGVRELVSFGECLVYMGLACSATPTQLALLAQIKPQIENAIRQELQSGLVWSQYTEFLPYSNASDLRDRVRYYVSPWHYPDGGMTLQLRELPVRQIISVYSDDTGLSHGGQTPQDFPEGDLLTEGYDYYLDWAQSGFCENGMLVRNRWPWPSEARSVKVTYIAGYAPQEFLGQVDDYRKNAQDARLGVLLTIAYNFQIANAANSKGSDVNAVAMSLGGRPTMDHLGDMTMAYSYPDGMENVTLIDNPIFPPRAAALLSRFKKASSLVS
jgi:hypothetical protein